MTGSVSRSFWSTHKFCILPARAWPMLRHGLREVRLADAEFHVASAERVDESGLAQAAGGAPGGRRGVEAGHGIRGRGRGQVVGVVAHRPVVEDRGMGGVGGVRVRHGRDLVLRRGHVGVAARPSEDAGHQNLAAVGFEGEDLLWPSHLCSEAGCNRSAPRCRWIATSLMDRARVGSGPAVGERVDERRGGRIPRRRCAQIHAAAHVRAGRAAQARRFPAQLGLVPEHPAIRRRRAVVLVGEEDETKLGAAVARRRPAGLRYQRPCATSANSKA